MHRREDRKAVVSVKTGSSLRILQVSTADIAGGAEKVAWELFRAYRARGCTSWLAVGRKQSTDDDVLVIPNEESRSLWTRMLQAGSRRLQPVVNRVRGGYRLQQALRWAADPLRELDQRTGREDFHFPGARHLLHLPPRCPTLVHVHNLHGGYFDLRALPWLSARLPLVMTLHDAWLLSGHCAHSLGCERWRSGCGHCPDLAIYPAIRRDATAYNWRRKRDIYRRSRLYVATPSQWLMDRVRQSILSPAILEDRVIPNGVDLSVFRPGDRQQARTRLGLPTDAHILFFTANNVRRNIWKDYATLRKSLARLAQSRDGKKILFIALGEEAPSEQIGRAEIRFIPYHSSFR